MKVFSTYHSDKLVRMEISGNPECTDVPSECSIINPNHQFLYLQVQSDLGTPLPPALFSREVILGVLATQSWVGTASEPPLDVFLLSDTEVILELSATAGIRRMLALTATLQWWIGHKVTLLGRVATRAEVDAARLRKTEERDNNCPQNPIEDVGEDRLLQLMEGIHKLVASESTRIPTFSGMVPTPRNDATLEQWIQEVTQAADRFPEPTVKNWIHRSLTGSPAVAISNLGPDATISVILQELELLFGSVDPPTPDVHMRSDKNAHPVEKSLNYNRGKKKI